MPITSFKVFPELLSSIRYLFSKLPPCKKQKDICLLKGGRKTELKKKLTTDRKFYQRLAIRKNTEPPVKGLHSQQSTPCDYDAATIANRTRTACVCLDGTHTLGARKMVECSRRRRRQDELNTSPPSPLSRRPQLSARCTAVWQRSWRPRHRFSKFVPRDFRQKPPPHLLEMTLRRSSLRSKEARAHIPPYMATLFGDSICDIPHETRKESRSQLSYVLRQV